MTVELCFTDPSKLNREQLEGCLRTAEACLYVKSERQKMLETQRDELVAALRLVDQWFEDAQRGTDEFRIVSSARSL